VQSVLRLDLRILGGARLSELRRKVSENETQPLERIRFYLQGEGPLVYGLYELLFNSVIQVELRAGSGRKGTAPLILGPGCIAPVGFGRDEGILPYTDRSFMGYRLLQEYFTFPEKFLFFELCELDKAAAAGFGDQLEVLLYLNRGFELERGVSPQVFRLNCAPIVNLFRQVAEPIQVTQAKTEYQVVPDVRRQMATEVYSIDSVANSAPHLDRPVYYQPFYSYKHGLDRDTQRTFWHAVRRESERKDDNGTEMYLSLVDLDFDPSVPDADIVTVVTTCTNRDLPGRLPFGGSEGDFHLEGPGIYSSIRCLRKPTATLRPPYKKGAQWRLISHLALNYLSLLESEGKQEPEAFQEMLRLYDFADSSVTRRQVAGVVGIRAKRVFRSVGSMLTGAVVRGLEITLDFDEQQYVGTGVFLFASVLERFLALYTSINSFTELVATSRQREGILRRWAPRVGEKIVV
jgi:type VI secretion system protein ImpG